MFISSSKHRPRRRLMSRFRGRSGECRTTQCYQRCSHLELLEDSEPRQDDSYECRVVLLRRDVSIERLCRQHYFRPPVAGLEDPVRRPWPALIKNVSFVVELEDHIAAIPCYLPGNLVYANLSMGMGIVDITIDTLNGTFRKRMPTSKPYIFR